MSLRFEEETNVYDIFDNILGTINEDEALLLSAKGAVFTAEELREIADYLENL